MEDLGGASPSLRIVCAMPISMQSNLVFIKTQLFALKSTIS